MKKAEFNFEVFFAIVVGALILFLAIYGTTKIGTGVRFQKDSEVAKEILILTEPLQAGFAEAKSSRIEFKQETMINNTCSDEEFGRNLLSVATYSRVGEHWLLAGAQSSVYNKYIFSGKNDKGKTFYIFSKSFDFPYKVSDLLFVSPEIYCFVSPPDEIAEDIGGMNIQNIILSEEEKNCTSDSLKVCFGSSSGCDIAVYGTCSNCDSHYEEGYVQKGKGKLYYAGNLMYGAIFSDKKVYDCNVKRLLYRTARLSEVYADKVDLMNGRGLNSQMKSELLLLGGYAMNSTAEEIIWLNQIAKDVQSKEIMEQVRLW